ncbi:hypothetical protein [Mesorhizobium amorphae]|uniref:hypothetical protein n=1 Tax=Mesorhizobium amorphae TaxID=71433 RepID=UPI001AEE1975|nr:hypothetical protein [Mesorhizobium amorphae]
MKRPNVLMENGNLNFRAGEFFYPIGILLGHHVIETREDEIAVPRFQGDPLRDVERLEDRSTGFGVVVPIEKVSDVIYSDDEIAKMKAHLAKQNTGFRGDSAPLSEAEIERKRDAGLAKALSTPPEPKTKPDTV